MFLRFRQKCDYFPSRRVCSQLAGGVPHVSGSSGWEYGHELPSAWAAACALSLTTVYLTVVIPKGLESWNEASEI